jgi:hypothetical protein
MNPASSLARSAHSSALHHFFHDTATKVAGLMFSDCIDIRNIDTAYRIIDCNYCYG